jgi:hypothetical protein
MCENDEYETSDPLTVGGATGQYAIPSPYHTECEWAMISVVGIGSLASTATFAVGTKSPKQQTLSATGADSFGNILTSGADNNNALPSFVGALTATAPFVTYGGDNYMPMPSPSFVFVTTTTPASTEVLVTVQFRRKLDRVLPDLPRVKPHTHSHVGSRRGYRTQNEGFASKYERDGVPYQHEQIPVTQDTGEGRRGVSPLQPTQTMHSRRGGDRRGR